MTDPAVRHAWQELSRPSSASARGSDLSYYHKPRYELLSLLRHPPGRALDVGCGAGATCREMKLRYPACFTTGVELSVDAAKLLEKNVDQAINDNIETMDFADYGIEQKSFDTVFFPDVLEHLRDPWGLLRRLKPYLTVDAQVIASIPNARNLWLLTELAKGNWTYEPDGLLDVTHVRFFTLTSMRRMFEQAGYAITHTARILDDRTANALKPQEGQVVNLDTSLLKMKGMTFDDIVDLKTMQFILVTTPV